MQLSKRSKWIDKEIKDHSYSILQLHFFSLSSTKQRRTWQVADDYLVTDRFAKLIIWDTTIPRGDIACSQSLPTCLARSIKQTSMNIDYWRNKTSAPAIFKKLSNIGHENLKCQIKHQIVCRCLTTFYRKKVYTHLQIGTSGRTVLRPL